MKSKIDRYFTTSYDELIQVATTAIETNNRNYDAVDLVSHAYEYCIKKINELETEQDIHRFTYRVILMHCKWRTSPINREILLKQSPFEGTDDLEPEPRETGSCEILEKILLEKWYADRRALIALYRERIKTDKPKQIILDKMIEFKSRNHRDIAKHFGITDSYTYLLIREIQDELKDFEREINNYDLKNNINR